MRVGAAPMPPLKPQYKLALPDANEEHGIAFLAKADTAVEVASAVGVDGSKSDLPRFAPERDLVAQFEGSHGAHPSVSFAKFDYKCLAFPRAAGGLRSLARDMDTSTTA